MVATRGKSVKVYIHKAIRIRWWCVREKLKCYQTSASRPTRGSFFYARTRLRYAPSEKLPSILKSDRYRRREYTSKNREQTILQKHENNGKKRRVKWCGQNPEEKQRPPNTRAHGRQKAGAALAAKETTKKKAVVDAAAKEKAVKNSKLRATAVIKRAGMVAAAAKTR